MRAEIGYRAPTLIIPLRTDPGELAIDLRRLRAADVRRRRAMHHRQRVEVSIYEALEKLEDLRQEFVSRLDQLHGDPDFEPDLAGYNIVNSADPDTPWNDDREADDDFEPSLGSVDRADQRYWAAGSCSDFEEEHDGREPECEDEGAQCDDEGDDTDTEPVCEDEGAEHDGREYYATGLTYVPDWPPTNTTMRADAP